MASKIKFTRTVIVEVGTREYTFHFGNGDEQNAFVDTVAENPNARVVFDEARPVYNYDAKKAYSVLQKIIANTLPPGATP